MEMIFYPDERLLKPCEEVTVFDESLIKTVEDMGNFLKGYKGMAVSGNQLGIMKRIFVMTPKLLDGSYGEVIELINPKIKQISETKANLNEGCLSAPNVYFTVRSRSGVVLVEFQDRNGNTQEKAFTGINAVCIQHELDHLNGIFFFEHLNREDKRSAEKQWSKQRKKLGV